MKIVYTISRILFGITFIFSGFVKGIDPWGSTYKFTDYFNAMGLDMLLWAAFPLGVLLAFAEFMIGIAFLFNWWMKVFSWLGLLFMAFFLPLTLWIALKNPVTDCGCFGDALVISNWETFYKNIFLMLFAVVAIVFQRKKDKAIKGAGINRTLSIAAALGYVIVVIYSYNHLPVFDFRPYKVGVNIPEAMSIPADAPREKYENIFYYRNKQTGEVKQFTEENYPWQDTVNWAYDNMESNLVQEGYIPPIHDFTIETPDGENIVDFFLFDENYVFVLVAYDLYHTRTDAIHKINELADWAIENENSFICLTSTDLDYAYSFADEHGAGFEFFNCDEVTLKTMIRSNPGLLVLKNGTIRGKWHSNDIPTPEEFLKEMEE